MCANFAHTMGGAKKSVVVDHLLNGDAYGLCILPVGNVQ